MRCAYLDVASEWNMHNDGTLHLTDKIRKVAWSRLGCVAYISPDGVRVNVRHLQCRSLDGKWQLSEHSSLAAVTETHGGSQLTHLCWNETGSELAVVDCLGRVSIYSLSMALNCVTGLRQASFDSGDDSSQIVGMMWLNTSRSVRHGPGIYIDS